MSGLNAPLLIWVDAQLPPVLARWLDDPERIRAFHVSEVGLLAADDVDIFAKARAVGAIVVTKDEDFVQLQERLGSPPQLVWLTCGNIHNQALKTLVLSSWDRTIELLGVGEPLVEINAGR